MKKKTRRLGVSVRLVVGLNNEPMSPDTCCRFSICHLRSYDSVITLLHRLGLYFHISSNYSQSSICRDFTDIQHLR